MYSHNYYGLFHNLSWISLVQYIFLALRRTKSGVNTGNNRSLGTCPKQKENKLSSIYLPQSIKRQLIEKEGERQRNDRNINPQKKMHNLGDKCFQNLSLIEGKFFYCTFANVFMLHTLGKRV